MSPTREFTDKFAVSLSLLCLAHCLILPITLVLLPSLAVLESEAFHISMICIVIPTSLYALSVGCKQHKRHLLLGFGIAGITLLILAVVLAETTKGAYGEKFLTVVGACLVATGHIYNFWLCKKHTCSTDPSDQSLTK